MAAAAPFVPGRTAMRRPPYPISCVLLAGLLVFGPVVPRIAAQSTAVPAESSVFIAPLAFGRVPTLPAAPALLAIVRVSAVPDASAELPPLPGPLVVGVEQGAFAVHTPDQVKVIRPEMTGEPSQRIPTPGPDFVLEPGDILIAPDGATLTFRNTGSVSADALMAMVLPEGTSPPSASDAGATVRVLASSVADDVPSGLVLLVLGRFALPPGAHADRDGADLGPVLGYVEEGTVVYTLDEGQARFIAPESGTPAATANPTAAPGTATPLRRGDAVFEETGTVGELRNESDGPASALFFLITPVEAAGAETAAR
jgi:quercetin dioxygenase-like cupin family protein